MFDLTKIENIIDFCNSAPDKRLNTRHQIDT